MDLHDEKYEVTLKLLRPLCSERKRKIYPSTWDLITLRCLLWWVESFLDRFNKDRKKEKKLYFWREPQRRPHTMINIPSSQNCHSLRAFSQFWEHGRIADGWLS